jgi:hypothetical protein
MALLVPQLLGFTPTESLTVLSLRPPRGRVGLTQRIDLPPPGVELPEPVADGLVDRVAVDHGTQLIIVVWSQLADPVGELAWARLVDDLEARADVRGLEVSEALLVRDERWWSYLCGNDACCRPDGTPVAESVGAESVSLVAAERALSGRAVLASREELEASIAPVLPLGEDFARRALASAAADLGVARAVDAEGQRCAALEMWRRTLDECTDPRMAPSDELRHALIASLLDSETRDRVLSEGVQRPREMQRLLETLCRSSVPPFDGDLCTLLAWIAYLEGGGALASIAIDRALTDNPMQSGARALSDFLDAGVHPDELWDLTTRSPASTRRRSARRGRRSRRRRSA